ncbi:MAG: carbohydrate ABC transporter permease [Candidatus Bathyarchaeota archaeon]|nr:carbohydrate ABC transporter permease [Candidatus Bathyarchaeota archaeon]MDH5747403.1 carbohydrate ABC transporter permease [Candidatus Bathyarchaeota archaeon]
MKIRKSTIIVHIIAWSVALIWILPFLGVLMAAIRPFPEILHGWWNFAEFNPSLKNFVEAWSHSSAPLGQGMLNSFLVAIPSTLIPMFVASLTGYGFARFSFPIRDYIFLTVVLIMALPQQMIAVPIFQIMTSLGLVNNYISLILVHSAWGLAWIILFMRNFFLRLPIEIEEAAKVDGASDFKIFYKIVLPMALPALASVAVLQFMWVWNDFFLALILIQSPDKLLATQRIPLMREVHHVDWSVLSAASILVMLVPILIYVLLQKYYIRGMIGWTVKG